MRRSIAGLLALAVLGSGLAINPVAQAATIDRVFGNSPAETGVALSKTAGWPTKGSVVLATSLLFLDAAAGGPLAAKVAGPLLLVDRERLPSATAAELERLIPKQIFILGSTWAISQEVEDAVQSLVPAAQISRIFGNNAMETSAEISKYLYPDGTDAAVIATDRHFSDSITVGPVAARQSMPILLADWTGKRAEITLSEVKRLGVKTVYLLGSTWALPASYEELLAAARVNVVRLAGSDPQDTTVLAAKKILGAESSKHVYLVMDALFYDGLTTAPVAAKTSGVTLLAKQSGCLARETRDYLLEVLKPEKITIVGSTWALAAGIEKLLKCADPNMLRWTWLPEELRDSPQDSARRIKLLPAGSVVEILGTEKNGYQQVAYSEAQYWIPSRVLSNRPPGYWEYRAINASVTNAPCPRGSRVENGLKPLAVTIYRSLCAAYPEITGFGGKHPDSKPWHPNGLAIDAMMPRNNRSEIGWSVALFLVKNSVPLDLDHVIFERQIWDVEVIPNEWSWMPDRGSISANHYDHVHVSLGRKYCDPACPR